jgi:hypothetical protein
MMDLNDEQQQVVAGWVKEGLSLSDIQKGLQEQLNVKMTYMDVRFLVLDLGLDVKDKPEPKKPEPEDEPEATEQASGVSVEVDRIMKPGALVSGTVVFPDGKSGAWALDQSGRLALDMGDADYKPSEDDVAAFQLELKGALEKKGF